MPDNIAKVLIEADITDQTIGKVEEGFSSAVSSGIEKGFNKPFDFKNLKEDLTKSLGQGLDAIWKNSKRVQSAQATTAEAYKKAQLGVIDAINSPTKGFGKTLGIVKSIGKQGTTGMASMLASTNPYVAAIKVAAQAVKFMANQFQRISKESSKFVGQGSLFTDKATMQMMQMTGQTATQAQATQRSLGSLGLGFEDIQQGKITAEQAAVFEQLRNRELSKLEQINTVAGPMFKSMQQVTLGFSLLSQDINDWITMAMASAPGVSKMLSKSKEFLGKAGSFMQSLISKYLSPIFSIAGEIVSIVMDIGMALMDAFMPILDILKPIIDLISNVVTMVGKVLTPMIKGVGEIIKTVLSTLANINIGGFKPFGNIGDTNNYQTQTTNNYIYGSSSMSSANPSSNSSNLFSNSYVLVND